MSLRAEEAERGEEARSSFSVLLSNGKSSQTTAQQTKAKKARKFHYKSYEILVNFVSTSETESEAEKASQSGCVCAKLKHISAASSHSTQSCSVCFVFPRSKNAFA